jgi:hypothetical protein
MRGNETDDRLSRMMMLGVDPKVIYRINKAMDNLDPWFIYTSISTYEEVRPWACLRCSRSSGFSAALL